MTAEGKIRKSPWVDCPFGVVSLLDMLEFYAKDYVELSHDLGALIATLRGQGQNPDIFGRAFNRIMADVKTLGLKVTLDQIGGMMREFVEYDPKCASLENGHLRIRDGALSSERLCYHLESVYSVLKSELGSISIRAIPREKDRYLDPKWLTESKIYLNFPSAWQEFQHAGRCYAYSENTACAFHLQRALEWGLKSLAVDLEKRFDRNCWERHLEDIEKALVEKYGSAAQRTKEQRFYSDAATQFGNMKVAWRNPTMHIQAKYDEDEAAYLLTTIEKFMTHLADNNLREPLP
jgi:hypothetical protein